MGDGSEAVHFFGTVHAWSRGTLAPVHIFPAIFMPSQFGKRDRNPDAVLFVGNRLRICLVRVQRFG